MEGGKRKSEGRQEGQRQEEERRPKEVERKLQMFAFKRILFPADS